MERECRVVYRLLSRVEWECGEGSKKGGEGMPSDVMCRVGVVSWEGVECECRL